MTRALDRWLDARTSPALRGAWYDLGAEFHTLAPPGSYLTGHAAAQLAHDVLGFSRDELAWLTVGSYDVELDKAGAPAAWQTQRDTPCCFLDAALDMNEPCNETWSLRELVHGDRGVQHLTVGWFINDGSRDGIGTGATVIRVFDRAAELAVSVFTSSRTAAVIAPASLRDAFTVRAIAGLDLLQRMQSYRVADWRHPDQQRVRALLGELAALVDPAFASSAFSVEIEDRQWQDARSTTVTAQGLPWGWTLAVVADVRPQGTNVRVESRLPRELEQRVFARIPRE